MAVGTSPVNRKPPEPADNVTFYRQRSSSFQNFQAVISGATQITIRPDKIFKFLKKDSSQVSEVVDPILKNQANNNQHRSTCCSVM
ncbi:MAG: hypothetical protein PVI40_04820 [Chlamydiota bacterium]|jgi:hypothetical protein